MEGHHASSSSSLSPSSSSSSGSFLVSTDNDDAIWVDFSEHCEWSQQQYDAFPDYIPLDTSTDPVYDPISDPSTATMPAPGSTSSRVASAESSMEWQAYTPHGPVLYQPRPVRPIAFIPYSKFALSEFGKYITSPQPGSSRPDSLFDGDSDDDDNGRPVEEEEEDARYMDPDEFYARLQHELEFGRVRCWPVRRVLASSRTMSSGF